MSGTYTQHRDLSVTLRGRVYTSQSLGPSSTEPWRTIVVPGSQVTTSYRSGKLADELEEKTPDLSVYARTLPSTYGDTGHEFFTRTQRYLGSSWTFHNWTSNHGLNPGFLRHVDGPLINVSVTGTQSEHYPAVPDLAHSDGVVQGTKAIRMASPNRPDAALGQALGELIHDGLPAITINTLRGRLSAIPRNAGSDYLNVEFGWKPLIGDITRTIRALKRANATVRQFQRDSGRLVRRRVDLPVDLQPMPDYTHTTGGALNAFPTPVSNIGWGRVSTPVDRYLKEQRLWFSGAFTYYVHDGSSFMDKLERYEALGNKVLGYRMTPALLWQLTPWSWLADWFFNLGDILVNQANFQSDGLVMQYGYLMRTTRIRCLCGTSYTTLGGLPQPLRVENLFETVQKERMRATPYGFGLNPNTFSVRQWAILSALGLTHAPNTLRP